MQTIDPGDVTETVQSAPAAKEHGSISRTRRAIRRLRKNPFAMVALSFLIIVILIAILAPLLAPYGYADRPGKPFQPPSGKFWLGTDSLGRDVASRLMFAARVSMQVSVSVVGLALLIAIPLGILAGYKGGRIDYALMRVAEAGLSFPPLILALAVAGVLGPGTTNLIWALAAVFVPGLMRVVRGQSLAVREETFIEASKAIGTRESRIMLQRVLPSVASPVIVQATVAMGSVLLAEAGLSYLGLGTRLPTPSFGNMLRQGYDTALFTHPWQVVIPGIAIALTVLSFNTFGDGLRDALGLVRIGFKGKARRGLTTVIKTKERAAATAEQVPTGPKELLRVENLTIEFVSERGPIRVVDDLNLTIAPGEVLGLVGESGSGKTVTALSIMRLLPSPPGQIVSGRVLLEGRDLLSLRLSEMRALRGSKLAMIFQDPMTSLDPAFTIGHHLVEAQRNHVDISRADSKKRAIELLDVVRIPDAKARIDSYPHQLSGGMRQRVMIATALARNPSLLIADEPTTALDVTVQAQILGLLRELQREFQMAILFVTHDLGVIADICDRVAVMYAGEVVETADVNDLFSRPMHPYTSGLLGAMPRLGGGVERLTIIPGGVPAATNYPSGCRFHPRCQYAIDQCATDPIPLLSQRGGQVRCIRAGELVLGTTPVQIAASAAESVEEVR